MPGSRIGPIFIGCQRNRCEYENEGEKVYESGLHRDSDGMGGSIWIERIMWTLPT
jgi:hypothetical protein